MVAKGYKRFPTDFSSAACAGVLFFTLCATAFAQGPKPEQKKEPLPPKEVTLARGVAGTQ